MLTFPICWNPNLGTCHKQMRKCQGKQIQLKSSFNEGQAGII